MKATVLFIALLATARGTLPLLEWHVHVYFLASNEEHTALADALRQQLLEAVRAKRFIAVCNGVDRSVLPQLSEHDASLVPGFNRQPLGPHTSGSFEVWVPREYYSDLLSFMLPLRGNLTYFTHPNGGESDLVAHTRDVAFYGVPYPLDLSVFKPSRGLKPPESEYPSLGLGYAAARVPEGGAGSDAPRSVALL